MIEVTRRRGKKTHPYRRAIGNRPARCIFATQKMSAPPRILFCNCTYAQVVPKEVKSGVLKKLCDAGVEFEAVADLCEMSARRDASLKQFTDGSVKIAACFPRAVKWLFHQAGAPLPIDATEILNMRTQGADEVAASLLDDEVKPNLPAGKVTVADAPPLLAAAS